MEVIEGQEKFEELVKFAKDNNKRICRFGISGTVHAGHLLVLSKIRKECDILIADVNEYIFEPWNSLVGRVVYPIPDHSLVEKSLRESGIVDFLIFNNSTKEYQENSLKLILEYKDRFFTFCKQLGFTKDLAVNSLIFGILSPIDDVTTSYVGPKCITQFKVAEKIFGQTNRWVPEFVWDFQRNLDGGAVSRTRGSVTLSKTVAKAVKELKRGVTNFQTLNGLMYEYFMEDPHFTIVDLSSVEKVDHITDNCSLVFMDGILSDYIHIKNGELVY